ncbi:aminoglycoside phosphotransferase family protein [Actinokineospora enzanensis]|uniref:aminoglycoside phosphotransferase family protein n=1 Tax=Actinokineospora enzanensis TaxID=155975 RepID=UPI001B7F7B32|nr:aminoglycoside phosphotransferase family protein [Actinokineospora enzanensis]
MTIPVPFAEATIRREGEAGRAWVSALPDLVAGLLDRWSCTASGEVMHGFVGVVVPAVRADGFPVVLKVGYPLSYTAEPAALAAWNGNGAARLLERDDDRFAMLLERLHPLKTPIPDPFTAVGALARRLAIPAPPGLPSLSDKAREWIEIVPDHAARLGSPLPQRVIDTALANARDLAEEPHTSLLHGDLHFGNIMRADDGLRVIDPNGLVGDPAAELLPLLRGDWAAVAAEPDLRRAMDRRIAEFAAAAEVDRDRVRRWTQARATETTLWSRSLGDPAWVTEISDTIASLL